MATATIRDLRTRFGHLKQLLTKHGEVILTDHGRPAFVLRPYISRRPARRKGIDYFARLVANQPRPLSWAAAKALEEASRDER